MSEKIKAHATVRVEVELTEMSWGPECNLDQVFRQAKRDALDKLALMCAHNGARIVSDPVVTAVLVPEKA